MLLFSAWFTPGTLPALEVCSFKRLTGLPCPGCGLTHAFAAITHGDVAAAWQYNPFAFALYPVLLLMLVSPLLNRVLPLGRYIESTWFKTLLVGGAAAMLVFGLARMLLQ